MSFTLTSEVFTSMRSIPRDTRFTGSASRVGAHVGVRHRHRPSSARHSCRPPAAQGAMGSVDQDNTSAQVTGRTTGLELRAGGVNRSTCSDNGRRTP